MRRLGRQGHLHQLDASDEIILSELMLIKFAFSCRVDVENFDFSAGVDVRTKTFMDPEESCDSKRRSRVRRFDIKCI